MSALPGDFYLDMTATGCRIDRTDKPASGALHRIAKSVALYHYLYDNLKIEATLKNIFQHRDQGQSSPKMA